jgi:hypothetical protein
VSHLTLQWSRHAAVPNPALRASEGAGATASRRLLLAPSERPFSRSNRRAASLGPHAGRVRLIEMTLGGRNTRVTTDRMSSVSGHIFLSYVRENAETVERLAADLEARGLSVWLDRKRLAPGERWRDAIRNAIRAGNLFIACFSRASRQRDRSHMNEELTLAIDELRLRPADRTWFIPVLLDEGEVPDRLIGAGETLRDLQWVHLGEDWSVGVEKIARVAAHLSPQSRTALHSLTEVDDPDERQDAGLLTFEYHVQAGRVEEPDSSYQVAHILLWLVNVGSASAVAPYGRLQVTEDFTIEPFGISERWPDTDMFFISDEVEPPAAALIGSWGFVIEPAISVPVARVAAKIHRNSVTPQCSIRYWMSALNINANEGVMRISRTEIASALGRKVPPVTH